MMGRVFFYEAWYRANGGTRGGTKSRYNANVKLVPGGTRSIKNYVVPRVAFVLASRVWIKAMGHGNPIIEQIGPENRENRV